jgi:hypothetical protein
MTEKLHHLLIEFMINYDIFRRIIDMQYTCESLYAGPNLYNNSFIFEMVKPSSIHSSIGPTGIMLPLINNTSLKEEDLEEKELFLILFYRRLIQVAFKYDKFTQNLVIVDAFNTYYYKDDRSLMTILYPEKI